MLDFGFSEILLTSAIALVVLGPERLPKVARQVGNWMGRARSMARQLSEQLEREVSAEELMREAKKAPPPNRIAPPPSAVSIDPYAPMPPHDPIPSRTPLPGEIAGEAVASAQAPIADAPADALGAMAVAHGPAQSRDTDSKPPNE